MNKLKLNAAAALLTGSLFLTSFSYFKSQSISGQLARHKPLAEQMRDAHSASEKRKPIPSASLSPDPKLAHLLDQESAYSCLLLLGALSIVGSTLLVGKNWVDLDFERQHPNAPVLVLPDEKAEGAPLRK